MTLRPIKPTRRCLGFDIFDANLSYSRKFMQGKIEQHRHTSYIQSIMWRKARVSVEWGTAQTIPSQRIGVEGPVTSQQAGAIVFIENTSF